MKPIREILEERDKEGKARHLSREFQAYGIYLAESLDDLKHLPLYIKLAKESERLMLQKALNYTKGYLSAKSKARVFMWKLQQLKTGRSLEKSG